MRRFLPAAVVLLVFILGGCSGREANPASSPTSQPSATLPTATASAEPGRSPAPPALAIDRDGSGKDIKVRWRWDSGLFNVIIWVRANGSRVAATYGGLYDGQGNFSPKPGGIALLDSATGTPIWREKTDTQAFPAAFISDLVVVGTANGTVLAFDLATGAERWRLAFDGIPYQAVDAGGVLVIADADPETWGPNGLADKTRLGGRVWGVEPASGTVLWKTSVGSFNAFIAVESLLTGGFIAASSSSPTGDGSTVVIEPATGKERWRTKLEASSPPAVEGSLLVVPGSSLQAFDLTTGAPRWSAPVPGNGTFFFPGITANAVIAGANGSLSVLDTRDGHLLATGQFGECVSRTTEWLSGLASGYGLMCGSLVRLQKDFAGWKLVAVLIPQGAIDSMDASGAAIVFSTGIGSAPDQVLFVEP